MARKRPKGKKHGSRDGPPSPTGSGTQKVEDEFLYYTQKAGDVARQLAIIGIGLLWFLLNETSASSVNTDPGFYALTGSERWAIITLMVSLGLDMIQYSTVSVAWWWHYRQTPDQAASNFHKTNSWTRLLIGLKLAALFAGYFLLGMVALSRGIPIAH